jgi:hypothetical protein
MAAMGDLSHSDEPTSNLLPIFKRKHTGTIDPPEVVVSREPSREVLVVRFNPDRGTDSKRRLVDQATNIGRAEQVMPLQELGRVAG